MSVELLLYVCRMISLAAGITALIAGLLMFLKPGFMKKLNNFLNKGISLEKVANVLDAIVIPFDQWVMLKPKIIGALLVALSAYLIFKGYPALFR